MGRFKPFHAQMCASGLEERQLSDGRRGLRICVFIEQVTHQIFSAYRGPEKLQVFASQSPTSAISSTVPLPPLPSCCSTFCTSCCRTLPTHGREQLPGPSTACSASSGWEEASSASSVSKARGLLACQPHQIEASNQKRVIHTHTRKRTRNPKDPRILVQPHLQHACLLSSSHTCTISNVAHPWLGNKDNRSASIGPQVRQS
jgi:hypothetical protein